MTYIDKSELFKQVETKLADLGLTIEDVDQARPWGGFFVISEEQAQEFANHFFEGLDIQGLKISGKLSPKILIVAPSKRLSWQYHHRRAEIWRVIRGEVGVVTSPNDDEHELKILKEGDSIRLAQGERHRLVGLGEYGVVAEIWQHTDVSNPSDEDDIVRVQDDFGRSI
ncbi:cupin domain-containing protein [Parapedobacter sp. SGR-10]|uniref:cupin domain-containing protein n=1 Tax=Parapedobacter sp. SGR-10 TaxID=2710879 RepID=UPI0013D337DB|nr:cupin domain-containing protein [Parapedobacter sp. SGR-10]NGF57004.1 cupin domain-containing protein [Parapedobacter sp. SGR-10]